MFVNRDWVARIKKEFRQGDRIELIHMNDPWAVNDGMKGYVQMVDDIGTVHCEFDNGRHLGLIPGEDSFIKIRE